MLSDYLYAYDKLYESLLYACDKRLIALAEMDWIESDDDIDDSVLLSDIEDEKLRKAAEWVCEQGYDSIDALIGHIIFTAEITLLLDPVGLLLHGDIRTINDDGYTIPYIIAAD